MVAIGCEKPDKAETALRRMRDFRENKKTGHITLHYEQGAIKKIEKLDVE